MRSTVLLLCCLAVAPSARGQKYFNFPPPFHSDSVELEAVVLKQILGLLCPGNERIGKESGCNVCPEGSSSSGSIGDLTIETALFGHFLGADSDDLLVGTLGCEPHAASTHGNVVFSRHSGVWMIGRKYWPGAIGYCRKIRSNRSGLDGLLCIVEDQWGGDKRGWLGFSSVGTGDYLKYDDSADDYESGELLQMVDNVEDACFTRYRAGDLDRRQPRRIMAIEAKISGLRLAPMARGRFRMTIHAQCRRGRLTAQAERVCTENGVAGRTPPLAEPVRHFRIEYEFDGAKFSLLPSSKAAAGEYATCVDVRNLELVPAR